MIGERGGTTVSLEQAEALHLEHRREWSARIRWRIAEVLVDTGRFHADDLVDLDIPADHKNIVGASVGAAVRKGHMVETGVRRRTSDPAGHGRRSAVYEVTERGRKVLSGPVAARRARGPVRLFEMDVERRSVSHYESEAA